MILVSAADKDVDLVLWACMGAVCGSLIGSFWVAVRWWRSSPCLADVARVVCPWILGTAVGAAYVVSRWNPSSEWVLEEIPSLRLWSPYWKNSVAKKTR